MGRTEKGAIGEVEVRGPVRVDLYRSQDEGPPKL
jgi:hypothetical protein